MGSLADLWDNLKSPDFISAAIDDMKDLAVREGMDMHQSVLNPHRYFIFRLSPVLNPQSGVFA